MKTTIAYLLIGSAAALPVAKPLLTTTVNVADLTNLGDITNFAGLGRLPIVSGLFPKILKRDADALLDGLPVVGGLGLDKLPVLNGLPVVGDVLNGGKPGQEKTKSGDLLGGLPVVGDVLKGGKPGQDKPKSGDLLSGLPVVGDLNLNKLPVVGGLGLTRLPLVGGLLGGNQKREADALLINDGGLKLPIDGDLGLNKLPLIGGLGLNRLPLVNSLPVVSNLLGSK